MRIRELDKSREYTNLKYVMKQLAPTESQMCFLLGLGSILEYHLKLVKSSFFPRINNTNNFFLYLTSQLEPGQNPISLAGIIIKFQFKCID